MWFQRVLPNNVLECVVTLECVAGLDCDISDNQLQLSSPTLPELTIAWAAAVQSDAAVAKLRKSERRLVVSAPLSRSSTAAERRVRLRVLRGERGTHTITFRDPGGCEEPKRSYVLVSKSGHFASRTAAESYSWAATFDAGTDGTVVTLGSGSWCFEAAEVCISYGRLERTEKAPRPIEASRAVDGVLISARQASVSTQSGAAATAAAARGAGAAAAALEAGSGTPLDSGTPLESGTPLDSVVFLPEREQLPTAELREACARYDAAFGRICGHEISSRDKQVRR